MPYKDNPEVELDFENEERQEGWRDTKIKDEVCPYRDKSLVVDRVKRKGCGSGLDEED